jgi:hypothetical protein
MRRVADGAGALLGLVVLSWGAPARARGTCSVEGKAVMPFVVTVAPKEAASFKLRVSAVPATITPGGLGQPPAAHVKAPIVFDGTVEGEVPVRTRRATEALNGLLRLAPATEKLTLHANVRARIVDAEVRIGGALFRGLLLPCDALTLDSVAEPEGKLLRDHPDAQRFTAAGALLHVRGEPHGGAAMEVALDDPEALELRQTEANGDWIHVTAEWPDGALLVGWIKRDELKQAGMAHERLGDVPRLPGDNCAPTTHEQPQTVSVDVKAGTQLYAARFIGAWARLAEGKKLTVVLSPRDEWLRVTELPHVDAVDDAGCVLPLDSAWITRAAVPKMPEGPTDKPPGAAPEKQPSAPPSK